MKWKTLKLGEILKLEYGKPLPDSKRVSDGIYPVYGANGVKGRSNEFYFGDRSIIIGRKGSAGELNLSEQRFWPLDVTYFVTFDKENYDLKFLYHLLVRLELTKFAKGVKPGINRNDVYSIEVSIPDVAEQKRIVKIVDETLEKIEIVKENAEKNLQNSKDLFESCLQSVFSNPGKAWKETSLGDVYDVRDGTHDSPRYQKEGFALVTSKNLKRDLLNFDKIKYISEKDYQKINDRSKVNKGDILFAMIGTIGNPVVVEIEPNFAIKNVALFKIPKNQNAYFLKYFLDSKYIIDKMMSEAKGTTQKFVGLGYLRSFTIKLPPLTEQKIIIKKLDALSVETRKLEAIYMQKIADLEELKKSLLTKAFAGEL